MKVIGGLSWSTIWLSGTLFYNPCRLELRPAAEHVNFYFVQYYLSYPLVG